MVAHVKHVDNAFVKVIQGHRLLFSVWNVTSLKHGHVAMQTSFDNTHSASLCYLPLPGSPMYSINIHEHGCFVELGSPFPRQNEENTLPGPWGLHPSLYGSLVHFPQSTGISGWISHVENETLSSLVP